MIEFRRLQMEDSLHDLMTLSQEFFKEYEAHHPDFFKIDRLTEKDVASYFSTFCGQPGRAAFIAVKDQQMVGYITVYIKEQAGYWRYKSIGEISGLMVHKDYRHQGIAKRLFAEAKDFLSACSVRYYTVYTAASNQAGLDFYRKNGLVSLYTTLLGELPVSEAGEEA
jgi:ribosomal protein S18 acetylase RimI-like enzyme